MIEKLTEQQEERMIEFREEWMKIGHSCEPADFDSFEKVIKQIYQKFLNKKEPFVWRCSSPKQAILIINLLRNSQVLEKLDRI